MKSLLTFNTFCTFILSNERKSSEKCQKGHESFVILLMFPTISPGSHSQKSISITLAQNISMSVIILFVGSLKTAKYDLFIALLMKW